MTEIMPQEVVSGVGLHMMIHIGPCDGNNEIDIGSAAVAPE